MGVGSNSDPCPPPKAKGRLLLRVVALSSDFSKIWFGFQTTTSLIPASCETCGLAPVFPLIPPRSHPLREFLGSILEVPGCPVPSCAWPPVARLPRESCFQASRRPLVYSLLLEDLSSVGSDNTRDLLQNKGLFTYFTVEIECTLCKIAGRR